MSLVSGRFTVAKLTQNKNIPVALLRLPCWVWQYRGAAVVVAATGQCLHPPQGPGPGPGSANTSPFDWLGITLAAPFLVP